jgi:hypothetical protein
MAVLGINYDGGNTYDNDGKLILNDIIYESVYLYTNKGEFLFKNGNFIKDWFEATKKFYTELVEHEPFLSHSSSVDHFFMDGADYDSAYYIEEGESVKLVYLDKTDKNWVWSDVIDNGVEFFVEKGTMPTWEEFKQIVKK